MFGDRRLPLYQAASNITPDARLCEILQDIRRLEAKA